jgi:hypothetical protein
MCPRSLKFPLASRDAPERDKGYCVTDGETIQLVDGHAIVREGYRMLQKAASRLSPRRTTAPGIRRSETVARQTPRRSCSSVFAQPRWNADLEEAAFESSIYKCAPEVSLRRRQTMRSPLFPPKKISMATNEQRPHQGRWCFGKTPLQTFLDAIPIAKEKMIAA